MPCYGTSFADTIENYFSRANKSKEVREREEVPTREPECPGMEKGGQRQGK
jgi:hypothetical protein